MALEQGPKEYGRVATAVSIAFETVILTPFAQALRRRRGSSVAIQGLGDRDENLLEGFGIALMVADNRSLGADFYGIGKFIELRSVALRKAAQLREQKVQQPGRLRTTLSIIMETISPTPFAELLRAMRGSSLSLTPKKEATATTIEASSSLFFLADAPSLGVGFAGFGKFLEIKELVKQKTAQRREQD